MVLLNNWFPSVSKTVNVISSQGEIPQMEHRVLTSISQNLRPEFIKIRPEGSLP